MSPASASHRTWRKVQQETSSAGARHFYRWVFSLLGLGLMALFVWYLILPWFASKTNLLVASSQFDLLASGSVAFADEDVRALQAVAVSGSNQLLPTIRSAKELSDLPDAVRQAVERQNDAVILYLNGQGISGEGKAQLICGDFPFVQRIDMDVILKELADCEARVKLLILDAVHLESDPRLGMVVNEFPALLEDAVRKSGDDKLWVLSSASHLEKSHASYALKQSIFAHFVTRALAGEADVDQDRHVSLDELYKFVNTGVTRATSGKQVPQLLSSTEDAQVDLAQVELLTVVPQQVAEASAEPAPAAEGTAASAVRRSWSGLAAISPLLAQAAPPAGTDVPTKPTDVPPAGETTTSAGPAAQKPAGESTTAGEAKPMEAAPPVAAAPVEPARPAGPRGLIEHGWQLRDRLQRRSNSSALSPVDFAPHLWREFNARLLAYESNYRSGGFDQNQQQQLALDLDRIEGIFRSPDFEVPNEARSLPHRFSEALAAARRYSDSRVHELEQVRNDAEFAAPYFVAWYSAASFPSTVSAPMLTEIEQFLRELAEFQLPQEVDPAQLEELERQSQDIRSDMAEIQRAIKSQASQLLDAGRKYRSQEVEALLSTPLLPADLRMQLVEVLTKPELLESELDAEPTAPPSTGSVASWRWDRLGERTNLQLQLVALADPGVVASVSTPLSAAKQEAKLQHYRQVGERLGRFYRELPRSLRDALADSGSANNIPRLLRLVDARDARDVPDGVYEFLRPLPPFRKPESVLAFEEPLSDAKQFRLNFENWTDLNLVICAKGERTGNASLTFEYDASQIELRRKDGQSVTPGAATTIFPPEEGRQELTYQVRARPGQTKLGALALTLTGGERPDTRKLNLTLPAVDRVALLIRRLPADQAERDRWTRTNGEISDIRLFPNRTTRYYLSLVNNSEREKKVRVDLLAVPSIRTSQPPDASQVETWLRQGRALRLGGTEKEFVLPIGSQPMPIPFGAFPPAPMPGAPPPAAAPVPAAPPAQDIPQELACVISDLEQTNRKWVHWINLAPLPPWQYLEPEVSYDAIQERIVINVRPVDYTNEGRPNLELTPLAEPGEMIDVLWDFSGQLPPETPGNTIAQLSLESPRGTLSASVPPADDKTVLVELTADGYPRAFLYEVPLDRDGTGPVARQREHRRVSIKMDDALRLVNVPPLPKQPPDLTFTLMIDAPEDFGSSADDSVEFGIDADQNRVFSEGETKITRNTDRDVQIRLTELGADGHIALQSSVDDFKVTLPVGGFRNRTIDVRGQLILDGEVVKSDAVPVTLDATDPEVSPSVAKDTVFKGDTITLTATASDLGERGSGVGTVKYKVARTRKDEIKDEDKLEPLDTKDGKTWSGVVDTAALAFGQHAILVRATDKVGRNSRTESVMIEVRERPKPPPPKTADKATEPVKPKFGTIRGRVIFDGEGYSGAKVQISGAKSGSTTSGANGTFQFDKMPAGAYEIKVEGTPRNKIRKADTKLEFTPPRLPNPVSIELE